MEEASPVSVNGAVCLAVKGFRFAAQIFEGDAVIILVVNIHPVSAAHDGVFVTGAQKQCLLRCLEPGFKMLCFPDADL